jgi:hypothetical protein
VAEQSEAVVLSRVELPDGRVLAFRDVQVVGFTCAEDAIAVVRALRPELAPAVLLQAP